MKKNTYKQGYSPQESQSGQSQAVVSPLIDQPRPSSGFLLFLGGCLLAILLILLASLLLSVLQGTAGANIGIEIGTFALLFLAICVFFGIFTYVGYHITYILTPHTLELKAGKISHFSMALHQIERIERVNFTPRLLGFGISNAALCNRFHNVVCLHLQSRRVYLSPSNVEQFIEQLEIAKGIRH
jgi:hypothetical protein